MTVDLILAAVEEETGVTRAEIMGGQRALHINQARRAAMYLCRHLCGMSYYTIGGIFGARHHTTILFSIRPSKKHNQWLTSTVPTVQARLQAQRAQAVGQPFPDGDSCTPASLEETT